MTGLGAVLAPRWGLLGGTFNPVHEGHLVLARAAVERFGLDRMIFIPAAFPPHKTPSCLAPAADRLEMLRLAISARPDWSVSALEIRRGGRSYTVETLRELRRELGEGAEFFLLVGADNLAEIGTWRRIEEIAELCRIVGFTRPGFPLAGQDPDSAAWLVRLLGEDRENLIELEIPVSSTEVREKAAREEPLDGLVPPPVAEYIRRRGLYREPNKKTS